jgi:alpha-N-arabinofuranosidase
LQNLNSYQWSPDLISYTADPDDDVLSTSYHMIQLFSSHRITNTLPIDSPTFGPAYYVAGYSNSTNSYLLKSAVYNATVAFQGVSEGATGTLTVLTAPDTESYNSIGSDIVVKTESSVTAGSGGVFEFELPDLSISVLEVMA